MTPFRLVRVCYCIIFVSCVCGTWISIGAVSGLPTQWYVIDLYEEIKLGSFKTSLGMKMKYGMYDSELCQSNDGVEVCTASSSTSSSNSSSSSSSSNTTSSSSCASSSNGDNKRNAARLLYPIGILFARAAAAVSIMGVLCPLWYSKGLTIVMGVLLTISIGCYSVVIGCMWTLLDKVICDQDFCSYFKALMKDLSTALPSTATLSIQCTNGAGPGVYVEIAAVACLFVGVVLVVVAFYCGGGNENTHPTPTNNNNAASPKHQV
eukprot:PhF_6_TR28093/c1_g1_i6/m.41522